MLFFFLRNDVRPRLECQGTTKTKREKQSTAEFQFKKTNAKVGHSGSVSLGFLISRPANGEFFLFDRNRNPWKPTPHFVVPLFELQFFFFVQQRENA